MIKLSVNEKRCSSLLARTRALILFISVSIFDFGPEKLPGLSRNGSQNKHFGAGLQTDFRGLVSSVVKTILVKFMSNFVICLVL